MSPPSVGVAPSGFHINMETTSVGMDKQLAFVAVRSRYPLPGGGAGPTAVSTWLSARGPLDVDFRLLARCVNVDIGVVLPTRLGRGRWGRLPYDHDAYQLLAFDFDKITKSNSQTNETYHDQYPGSE